VASVGRDGDREVSGVQVGAGVTGGTACGAGGICVAMLTEPPCGLSGICTPLLGTPPTAFLF